MQNIKPSDMTKREKFSVWLAANDEHEINLNPVETGNPLPSAAAFGSGIQHRKHNALVEVTGQNF
jgi:hypothetical protein